MSNIFQDLKKTNKVKRYLQRKERKECREKLVKEYEEKLELTKNKILTQICDDHHAQQK